MDQRCFVQFMHPGGEWGPGEDGFGRPWNRAEDGHGRKFVFSPGRYLEAGRTQDVLELAFWCEWEGPSRKVVPLNADHEPHHLHQPTLELPDSYDCLQNTDPSVFGGFFYTGCRQHRDTSETRLHHLAPGSVIAFGSSIDKRFRLDTVFVVGDSVVHTADDYRDVLADRIPDGYRHLTIDPWYADCPGCASGASDRRSYRLYFGRTYDAPTTDGLFSFFPAVPAERVPMGFERPAIADTGVLAGAIGGTVQAYKVTYEDPGKGILVADIWHELLRQVTDEAHLKIGVWAEMPPVYRPDGGDL